MNEQEKYIEAWKHDAYRAHSPGDVLLGAFFRLIRPRKGATIIDLGCGPGRASEWLENFGFKVIAVDIAPNCLDKDVKLKDFRVLDVRKDKLPQADYVFCTDVMEHIPPEDVDFVLKNILNSCDRAYLNISYLDDEFGKVIGEPLHLTVRSHEWWKRKISSLGGKYVRDHDGGMGGYHVFGAVLGSLNNTPANVRRQTLKNLKAGYPEAEPHRKNRKQIAIVGGGPTLPDHLKELRRFVERGGQVCAVNGTHDYLIENGITPDAMVMIDTRRLNAKFVKNPDYDCTYLISSSCHPKVFENLKGQNILTWHAGNKYAVQALKTLGYKHRAKVLIPGQEDLELSQIDARVNDKGDHKLVVAGGSTVVLRAINLLYVLGYRKMRIYGMDCCYVRGKHHAYPQTENWSNQIGDLKVAGKRFLLEPWMHHQAQEFFSHMQDIWPDDLNLDVRGDGLIATLLEDLANGGDSLSSLQSG